MTFSHLAFVFFNLHNSLKNGLGCSHAARLRDISLHYDTTSDAASHETCLSRSTADVSTCSSTSYGTARTACSACSSGRTATSIQSQSISSGGCGSLQSHESLWRWRPCVSTTSEDGIALRHFLTGAEDFYTYTYDVGKDTS